MSVSIQLHPLAVLNISDHMTRATYLEQKDRQRVIGALLGRQQGRVMEVVNTVEISFKPAPEADGGIRVDDQFCQMRLEAYKKLFPDLDCIGWYTSATADQPTEADVIVHKRFTKFSENPMVMVFNPLSQEAKIKKILPLFLYDLNVQQSNQFTRLDYSLASSDSERIAVDHIAKAIDPNAKISSLSNNMVSSLNGLKFLRRKIRFLIDIVKNSEEVRKNHEFMRKLNQICTQLPITSRHIFDKHAFTEYSDIAAVNMMATVTKSFEMLNELLDDFKTYYGKDMSDSDMSGAMMGNYGMDEETMSMLGMGGHGMSSKGMFGKRMM